MCKGVQNHLRGHRNDCTTTKPGKTIAAFGFGSIGFGRRSQREGTRNVGDVNGTCTKGGIEIEPVAQLHLTKHRTHDQV